MGFIRKNSKIRRKCNFVLQKCTKKPNYNSYYNTTCKSRTSVGANYCEADDAESKKDFRHKIGIVKKESRESKHFIRMIVVAVPKLKEDGKPLWQEAKELNLIFNSIYKKVN